MATARAPRSPKKEKTEVAPDGVVGPDLSKIRVTPTGQLSLPALKREQLVPEMLGAVVSAVHQSFLRQHKTVLTPAQQQARMGGLLLPALSLRWVFAQNTIPLATTLTLSGLQYSCKTALAIEMARWVVSQPGIGWYNDVERKFSADTVFGVMFHRRELVDRLNICTAGTQNDWHSAVYSQVETMSTLSAQLGYDVVPGIAIVDSVAAAQPVEVENKFEKAGGEVGRSFSEIALNNSRWLQSIPSRVAEQPFILVMIQHSKDVPIDGIPGMTQRVQKGGAEVQFVKTTGFELTRTKTIGNTKNAQGFTIQIKCSKNAFGVGGRVIEVDYRWPRAQVLQEDGTCVPGQYMYWDWHAATIKLLVNLMADKQERRIAAAIASVVDLHAKTGGRWWSDALGVSSADAMSASMLGERLEYDYPHLVAQLYDILDIAVRPVMVPGTPLRDVWDGIVPRMPVMPSWLPRGWRLENQESPDVE
jgi:hypothetical protein